MDDDFEDNYGSGAEEEELNGEIDDLDIVNKTFEEDPAVTTDPTNEDDDVEAELAAEDEAEVEAEAAPVPQTVIVDHRNHVNIPTTLLTGKARILNPRMTKNEYAKIRAVRCEQIEKGDAIFVDCGSCEPSEICEAELRAGKCPLSVLRPIKAPTATTGGEWELWSANELQWGEALGRQ